MRLLVVGGGGREHAIIKKLKENPSVDAIFALPGNGGMAEDATLVAIGAKEIEKPQIDKLLDLRENYYKVTGKHPGYKHYNEEI